VLLQQLSSVSHLSRAINPKLKESVLIFVVLTNCKCSKFLTDKKSIFICCVRIYANHKNLIKYKLVRVIHVEILSINFGMIAKLRLNYTDCCGSAAHFIVVTREANQLLPLFFTKFDGKASLNQKIDQFTRRTR